MKKIHWLWNRFSNNNLKQLINFLQPPPQVFATEMLWLIQRYIIGLLGKNPKNIQPINEYHTLQP